MLLSRSPSGPKKYFPIPVVHLEEEIRVRSADDCKRFREEFNVSVCGTRGVGGILCLLVLGFKNPDRRCLISGSIAQRLGTLASVLMLSPK